MNSHKKPKTINPDDVDPSVYYYDEVYDEMQRTEEEDKKKEKERKRKEGSKYIQGISETAERRKSEKEVRKFRRYARDREEAQASGDLQGEDVYISKSYEKKLKEIHETIKARSKPDDERAFNVFKKLKRTDEERATVDSDRQQKLIEQEGNRRCDTEEPVSRHVPSTKDGAKIHPPNETTRIQRPTSLEERRDYLKEILAKRTIGDVFKAAQERYRQRKAKLGT